MNAQVLARRSTIFVVVFGGGMAIVAWAAGGLFVDAGAASGRAAPAVAADPGPVVDVAPGTGLGAGRGGSLHRDDVAIVGDRPVPYREFSATWDTSTPGPPSDTGASAQRLTGARIVVYPRPTKERPNPVVRDDAPGVTIVEAPVAVLRRPERGPPSVHAEGGAVVTHVAESGGTMVLRAPTLDVRKEDRDEGRASVQVVETPDPVRIAVGDAEIEGTGLRAELAEGDRGRRVARVLKDVRGVVRGGGFGAGGAPADLRMTCRDAAEIESLDRPARDGSQAWRATFRDDVKFEDDLRTMTAEHVVVDFVHAGDREAGRGSRGIPEAMTASGGVRIVGRLETDAYDVTCETLRSRPEDAITDVTVLEGSPVMKFHGRAQESGATSLYEIRCKGPATMRQRRAAADRRSRAATTLVFEGDVVAVERDPATQEVRSELRAPRVVLESTSDETGRRYDPQVFRAEQGAEVRYRDFAARGQTIVATAAPATGGPRKIALTGSPATTWSLPAGSNPLGGAEPAGLLVLSSDGRIDVELAPEPASGPRPTTGTRAAAKVTGGMTVRKLAGETTTWTMKAREGDAKLGWDGLLEEMHATGDAVLTGRGGDVPSSAMLTGDRVILRRAGTARPPGGKGSDAWSRLDAFADGTDAKPAVAFLDDGTTRRHEIRARQLLQTDDGTVLLARGAARAELHRTREGDALVATANEIRVDLDRGGERSEARLVTASGGVVLAGGLHQLVGDRVVYQVQRGEAEATGRPAQVLRYPPADPGAPEPAFPSYARGEVVRAWFDPQAKAGPERFVRATLPKGGEIVAYEARPQRIRVTTTCRGPLELTRTTASCVQDVVCLYEQRPRPDAGWQSTTRVDAKRLDLTFDATGTAGQASDRIRTMLALGTPEEQATVRAKSPTGDREAYATAERIEGHQALTKMTLTCPSGRSKVYFHDVTTGKRGRMDSVTFNYVTFEWTDMARFQALE